MCENARKYAACSGESGRSSANVPSKSVVYPIVRVLAARRARGSRRPPLLDRAARIEALETEQAELNRQLADPDVYRKEGANVGPMHARVEQIDEALLSLLARWEGLGGG